MQSGMPSSQNADHQSVVAINSKKSVFITIINLKKHSRKIVMLLTLNKYSWTITASRGYIVLGSVLIIVIRMDSAVVFRKLC